MVNTERIRSRVQVSPLATSAPLRPALANPNLFCNPNVEPSSYRYTSTEWLSDMPTNFGLPPVRCSQWHKKNGYLDRLKLSR